MRRVLPVLMILAVIIGGVASLRSQSVAPAVSAVDERVDGSYYSLVDESGNVLHVTGHRLEPGDEWVTSDNRHFEVTKVEGDIAFARFTGAYDLAAQDDQSAFAGLLSQLFPERAQKTQARQAQVAIYHTHSDESYVQGDGTYTKNGRGGVYDVGRVLKESLAKKNVNVVQDLTNHLPHDAGAYNRSRPTAANLLKLRPVAMFDVHRDAAPPQAYAKTVNGQDATQVVVVIGKANPKYKSNAAFANALKAQTDKSYPGLIKGLMFRNGDYNQDLYDRLLLLEVGAHTNTKEAALQTAELISGGIAKITDSSSGAGGTEAQSRGSFSALGWVLGLTVLGVVVYMFVSTGSLKEAVAKLRRFGREDLAGFLGWSKPEKGKNCETQPNQAPLRAPEDKVDMAGSDAGKKEVKSNKKYE